MSEENKKPITEAEAVAALCSKKWLAAIKSGDRITTYQMYLDWLSTSEQGALYQQQMCERIIYALSGNDYEKYLRQVTDCALHAERFVQDEAKAAPRRRLQPMAQAIAEQKAIEWENLLDDADAEWEAGCCGTAEKLRGKAIAIEKELESHAYNALQLLKQIKARRRGCWLHRPC